MVSDHALKLAIRAQMDRYNRRAARTGQQPMSYTEMRAHFLLPSLREMTSVRQEQAAAGIAALEAGRDLIVCGGINSGKTALIQAISGHTDGSLYVAQDPLEYGKELGVADRVEWSDSDAVRERIRFARRLCFDELRGYKTGSEEFVLAADKPIAVTVHAMHPQDGMARIERFSSEHGGKRKWNDPTILFCRWEDRLPEEAKREIEEKKAREQARLDSVQPIVNG